MVVEQNEAAKTAAAAQSEEVAANERHVRELFESLDVDNATTLPAGHRRELFPMLISTKCARLCSRSMINEYGKVSPMMSVSDQNVVKGPVKAMEMLALNEDLNTVVQSGDMCTRRHALARAAGLAAGLSLAAVREPGFAAETKTVKMGSDSGQLVFVPDEIKICKGDSVTWVNNKGGPHNVVFDEEAIPSGVESDSISMTDGAQLGDEGETFTKKFETAGSYAYYCEPHRGAGMNANLIVS